MSHDIFPNDRQRNELQPRAATTLVDVSPAPLLPVRVGVRDFLGMIARHKRFVALVVVLVTLPVAALLVLLTPDFYAAKARVEIAMERPGKLSETHEAQGGMVSTDPAYFNTQLQLMTSPAVLRRAIVTADLEHDEVFKRHMSRGGRMLRRVFRLGYFGWGPNSGNDVATPPDLAGAERLAPMVAELQRRISIRPVLETRTAFRETRLADVLVQHQSPRLAAGIANAVADAFVAENRDRSSRSGASTNVYLGHRIESLQGEVRQAEEALIAYGRDHQILSLEPTQNTVVERLMSLNKRLLEAENDRKLAEANLLEAQRPESANALGADNAKNVLADTEMRLAELRAKRAQLLVGATEQWPEVREITEQITALEANAQHVAAGAATTALGTMRTRYLQAQALEATLRADFETQRGSIQAQNQAAVSYRLMQQEVKTKQGLLEDALTRLGENDLAQAAVANNASVADYALAPNPAEPEGPWRLPYVAAAFMFGLVMASGAAIGREAWNHTLRSSVDVEESLDLPALGSIRAAPSRRARLFTRGADRLSWNEFAEDYRRLRTAMLLPAHGQVGKTWLVTSSHPHEGKTTTAVNLTASLVKSGARVVLVDADLRRPRLHSILGFDNSEGLSTLLTSVAPLPEHLAREHQSSGIYLLTAGPESAHALELLGFGRMSEVLAALHAEFDHVVIDSPPIALYPDGLAIASKVDGVLLVVKASTTPLDAVRDSKRILQRVGAKVYGVVLNRVRPLDQKYYGYSGDYTSPGPSGTSRPRLDGWAGRA